MDDMQNQIEVLLGMHAGVTIMLSALLATHPAREQFDLKVAALLEHAAPSTLWPTLNARQQAIAAAYVDSLQRIQATPTESDPLTRLGFRWRGQ